MGDYKNNKDRLLLELPLKFLQTKDGIFVESQAFNGLKKWSENFSYITVCAPTITDEDHFSSSVVWKSLNDLPNKANLQFVPLPVGYAFMDFFKYRLKVEKIFKQLIPSHHYLLFSNIGTIGSWGNIAVDIASNLNRDYGLWFDWVIHEMIDIKSSRGKRKLKACFDYFYAKYKTISAIKKCSLGLFHGKSVFDAYNKYCNNPQLVHDIHLTVDDAINDLDLVSKLKHIHTKKRLTIGYVGRVHPMKAPFDWVSIAESTLKKVGPDQITFCWLGDGPQLTDVKRYLAGRELIESISFLGFESDRAKLLSFLKDIDVFLFCHITPESPRCLIESLLSATPIVGYSSPYAEDLLSNYGGGKLFDIGKKEQVACFLKDLVSNRYLLEKMTEDASKSRALYNDTAVFKHRSDLIKKFL